MRNHLSLKQIAEALGCQPTYAGQAIQPALDKMARLVLMYDELAMLMLLERVQELRAEREQQRFEQELPERIKRQTGGRRSC